MNETICGENVGRIVLSFKKILGLVGYAELSVMIAESGQSSSMRLILASIMVIFVWSGSKILSSHLLKSAVVGKMEGNLFYFGIPQNVILRRKSRLLWKSST